MFNVLVVEDEKNLRKLMTAYLKKNQYNIFEAEDGVKALEVLENTHIDIIISDIMMSNMDGYELTRELRQVGINIPILMVTAKDNIEDKREGFLAGSDDYMVKPVDMEEMILRVGVLLRRANINIEKRITIGDVILNYNEMTIRKNGKIYEFPQKEFQILYKLLSYPERIFTRQDLMEEIWGVESESDPRTVDVHIKRVREKLKGIDEFEISTIRGLGYKAIIKGDKK